MFWNLYKYKIKILLKTKEIMFWSFVYPLLLSTLFFVAFGSKMPSDNVFSTINVAVVENQENHINETFKEVLEEVEYGDETKMFNVKYENLDSAKKDLTEEEISGIIILDEEISLVFGKSGISESIIKQFTDVFKRNIALYQDAATIDASKMELITSVTEEEADFIENVSLGGEKMNSDIQFYYGLIAMTCLFGCFVGISIGGGVQANGSPEGARKVISSANRLTMILADLTAAETLHYIGVLLVCGYTRYVLKMPIGDKILPAMAVLFLGSLVGIELGQFVSCFTKGNTGLKVGISLSISLVSGALSGLMSSDLKRIIDENAPLVSKINPGTVIANCFYYLSAYNDYRRFTGCLIVLAIEAVILLAGSFIALRRCKYVSV